MCSCGGNGIESNYKKIIDYNLACVLYEFNNPYES